VRQPEPVAVTVHTAGLEVGSESDLDSNEPGRSFEPDSDFDDWALDFELQRLQRLVAAGIAGSPVPESSGPVSVAGPFSWQTAGATAPGGAAHGAVDAAPPSAPRRKRASIAVWALLCGGTMAFVCGAVLLAWSLIAGRNELWTLGMPACLAGQLGLLLGVVFQLTRMWDENRQTANQFATVDERLAELKHAAAMLSTGNGTPAQSFYAHMAGGASPQILLADLKSQLDLLTTQMATTRR
jgi:hypothetical protein